MLQLERQWCDQVQCCDFGKVDVGNIQIHSYVERRLYCTTCLHTFSADHGPFFETVRSERSVVLEILELLGERNSLRAIERLKHHSTNTVVHGLDLAGQHRAAVSAELIHDLSLRPAQVDDLWTFVKKSKCIARRAIPPLSVILGFGGPSLCPVGCAWSVISAPNGVKLKPPSSEPNLRRAREDALPCSPAINCRPMSKR